MKRFFLAICCLTMFSAAASAQATYIDKHGIWRWRDSQNEVCIFGINYTVPFAHAYRTAKRLNVDIEKAIDMDVYHFARLGFDGFRVHVWDTEISDTLGNLINNDHLRLFDYLIYRMKERGMKFIITPIAYWGNGLPEPDEKTPGFSKKYGKEACLEHPDAIKAQQRYLAQFVRHVNRYTGLAYKDDPDVLAFEICNEPHHKGTTTQVRAFINSMVKAIRSTGTNKPVFYNVTHSTHLADAYFSANIQGGTYQWYPTGLGARHSLGGNLLPYVDRYPIPFSGVKGFSNKTRIVYEFDAADCAQSYAYPAMARSFRTAGMQAAMHFAYDPTYMAPFNTEYGTHYMNLIYAPHKAIALMIAAEVFRSVPLYQSYGTYPQNTVFRNFRINHNPDLAELNSEEKFFHSRSTTSAPVNFERLRQIAGTGNSAVVQYEGTGAYFLDKIAEGIWRLEVLPDVIWVNDPFGRTSPEKTIARIGYFGRSMRIRLPELPENFEVKKLNGKSDVLKASNHTITVLPGSYMIGKRISPSGFELPDRLRNIGLNEFYAPPANIQHTEVIHHPPAEVAAEKNFIVEAEVAAPQIPGEVSLYYRVNDSRYRMQTMRRVKGFTYQSEIQSADLPVGILEYFIVTRNSGSPITFPDGFSTSPDRWDFHYERSYRVRIVQPELPVYLFNAGENEDRVLRNWSPYSYVPAASGKLIWKINVSNPQRSCYYDSASNQYLYAMRYHFADKIQGRKEDIAKKRSLVIRARSAGTDTLRLQVALLTSQGAAYGTDVLLTAEMKDTKVSVDQFKPQKSVLMPRGYPIFVPYWFEYATDAPLLLKDAESLQLVILIPGNKASLPVQLELEEIRLE